MSRPASPRRSASIVLAVAALLSAACSSGGAATDTTASDTVSTTVSISTTATSTSDTSTSDTSSTSTEAPDTATTTSVQDPSTADESAEGCARSGPSTFTLAPDGVERTIRVFVPSGWDGSERLPTVLNWHGLGSNGPDQAGYTAYEDLAESEGFVVVHPTGAPGVAGVPNWEISQFPDPTKDDVAFAVALIDELVESFCTDPDSVYSTGFSNGGLFTSVLVCQIGDRLAGAVSVGGTTHADDCVADDPVPYLSFHGTADRVVSYDGSTDNGVLFAEDVRAEFAEFAADMGCDPDPETSSFSASIVQYTYLGCDEDVPLALFEIIDGTHTWPGAELDLGGTTREIDATVFAWEFFSS